MERNRARERLTYSLIAGVLFALGSFTITPAALGETLDLAMRCLCFAISFATGAYALELAIACGQASSRDELVERRRRRDAA